MIREQVLLVCVSYVIGLCISILYFILCVIKKLTKMSLPLKAVIDFIFWEAGAAVLFYATYKINEGSIRGYSIAALFLGFLTIYSIICKITKSIEQMHKKSKKV